MNNVNYKEILLAKKKELEIIGSSLNKNDIEITSDNMSEINELSQVISTNNVISLIEVKRNKELKIINQQLSKMDSGDFGCCEECDSSIGDKRLLANPLATLCIDCQSSQEKKIQTHRKKVA